MAKQQPLKIDFNQKDAIKQILPCKPILTSHQAGWHNIYLEHHRQPDHETPEYSFPAHTISIGLGYQAKEFRVNGRLYKNFVIGNIGIIPANYSVKTQAYGNAEFILLSVQSSNFTQTADELIDIDRVELLPQIWGFDPLIYQIGLELRTELEIGGADSCLYAETMATTLSVHLLRRYLAQKQKIKEFIGGLPKYKLREVITYINDHLDQDITIAELATLVQMSSHYFSSLFKQSTGFAPHQYVTKCRIERAKQLLATRELPIVEICHQVGFHSQSHFTRIFRKYTTTTPKLYRDSL